LSEAIAAQYLAQRPWWRRAADALGDRVPPTLRGRWGLEFRAAVALACPGDAGASVGGWYLWALATTVIELPARPVRRRPRLLPQQRLRRPDSRLQVRSIPV